MDRKRQNTAKFWASAFCMFLGTNSIQAAVFMGIGDLPGGFTESRSIDISSDGLTVVGFSASTNGRDEAFSWTLDNKILGLGDFTGNHFGSRALGISDNNIIVGWGVSEKGREALRILPGGNMESLNGLNNDIFASRSWGISSDGSVIVGEGISSRSVQTTEAFRWTKEGGVIGLGDLFLDDGVYSWSTGGSGDGTVVVGVAHNENKQFEAFRWTEQGVMEGLGDFEGGTHKSSADGISSDGTTIFGSSNSDKGTQAFRWTREEGMVNLGSLPEGYNNDTSEGMLHSHAIDASADGSIIVGEMNGLNDSNDAMIWDEVNGIRSIQQLLIDLGLDNELQGWDLIEATGISDDGRVITGRGEKINDANVVVTEAWVAVIPEPSSLALLLIAGTAICKRRAV